LNETLHHFPRRFSKENHSIDGVFTQPGSIADALIAIRYMTL
jgi:hypothetical protein